MGEICRSMRVFAKMQPCFEAFRRDVGALDGIARDPRG